MLRLGKGIMLIVVLIVAFIAYVFLMGGEETGRVEAGWLVISQPEDADILDPCRTVYPWASTVNNLMYESLLTYDYDMNIIPMLAEDLPTYNEGGMYYEFKLRKDVKFHCGHPFTAYDVVYTLERIKELPGSVHMESLKNVLGAEAIDNYTVRVYLTEPDRYLKDWFATGSSVIVCSHCAREHWLKFGTVEGPPCGTGPFKFKEWKADDRILLERFDDYSWGPEMYSNKGPAYLEGVQFQVIPEHLTAEAKFEAEDIDILLGVRASPKLFERWEANPDIVLHKGAQVGNLVYLGFNCAGTPDHGYGYENGDLSPGDVPKAVPKEARRAIAYALNENRFIELAYAEVGTPPISWLADTIWGAADYQESMYPYDPEMAKEILENAGYGEGLELEVIHWTDPHYDVICTEMARQLENVGITLNHASLDFNIVQTKVAEKDYNMFVGGYNWPLADMIWWEWHTCRLPSPNRFWWGDAYADAVIDNTWAIDDDVALEALHESQRLIAEDAAGLGLLHRGLVGAWRSSVKGYRAHPIPSNWHLLDTRR